MKVAVVADDLTGANATSALLSKKGFSTITCLEQFHDSLRDFDIISFTTDSRSVPEQEAYQRVQHCLGQLKSRDLLISKRIDSTLRGNLGAEVDAVIDSYPELMAIVVPVYPASGRICVGGSLLIGGVPLQNTAMRHDPKNPMTESSVLELFAKQSHHQPGYIPLRDVLAGEATIVRRLQDFYHAGKRIAIFDATTDDDILTIARAVESAHLPIFCVDPGPFTAQLVHLHYAGKLRRVNKVFVAIGSVSELTQRQIKKLRYDRQVWLQTLDPCLLIDIACNPQRATPLVSELLEKAADFDIVGIDTVELPEHICNLGQIAAQRNMSKNEASMLINQGIAEVTAQILTAQGSPLSALYSSGGDVTVAITNRLGSRGFLLKDEVEPLTVYGHLVGGACEGLSIITKGGFVGNDHTLVHCIDYLAAKVSSHNVELRPQMQPEPF